VGDLAEFSEIEELRGTVRNLERRLRKSQAGTEDLLETFYRAARDGFSAAGAYKTVPQPTIDRRKKGEEVAVWHLTDWQGGKLTTSYNLEVMASRVAKFCAKARHITEIQRADHPVRRCTVLLGGDLLEGTTVFPGQVYELDDVSAFSQAFRVCDVVEAAIRSALSIYDRVDVVAEDGNHGRIGRRGDVDRGDNWDRVIYKVASERFAKEPRITWQMNRGHDWHQRFTIGNYKAILVHGDEIKSFGGGTPAFGILRKVNSWATGVIPEFTDCYMGHWHTPMTLSLANGGRIFVSGSLESDNVYAQEFVGALGVPSQRLHYVDGDAGRVSAEYVIWLND
jgi:DNA repair exonuclease SbcCD nuclease subunit